MRYEHHPRALSALDCFPCDNASGPGPVRSIRYPDTLSIGVRVLEGPVLNQQHRRAFRILDLEPRLATPRPIAHVPALRNDAFQSELAGALE